MLSCFIYMFLVFMFISNPIEATTFTNENKNISLTFPRLTTKCATGKVYKNGRCLDVFCSYGFIEEQSTCVKKNNDNNEVISKPNFNSCIMTNSASIYMKFIGTVSSQDFENIESGYSLKQTRDDYIIEIIPKNKQTLFKVEKDIENWIKNSNVQSLAVVSAKVSYSTLYGFDIGRTFANESICADLETFPVENKNFMLNCSYNMNNKIYQSHEYVIWSEEHKKEKVYQRKISVCKNFYHTKNQFCRMQLLDNYKIKNFSIVYNKTILNPNSYLPFPEGIAICKSTQTDVFPMKIKISNHWTIALYILPASMFCYVWLITVHFCFKSLRNTLGYINVGFCFSFLIADVLLYAELFTKEYCSFFGIAMHWTLLLGFTWLLLLSCEICRTRYASLTGSMTSFKRIIAYVIIALFVASSGIIFQIFFSSGESLKEYKSGHKSSTSHNFYHLLESCWICALRSNMFSYILPISIVTIISILLLTISMIMMKRNNNGVNIANNSSQCKSNSPQQLALKILLIVFMIEGLSFLKLTSVSSMYAFAVCYTITRSLKGVIIFLVMILSETLRTLHINKIKSLICKSKESDDDIRMQSVALVNVKESCQDEIESETTHF